MPTTSHPNPQLSTNEDALAPPKARDRKDAEIPFRTPERKARALREAQPGDPRISRTNEASVPNPPSRPPVTHRHFPRPASQTGPPQRRLEGTFHVGHCWLCGCQALRKASSSPWQLPPMLGTAPRSGHAAQQERLGASPSHPPPESTEEEPWAGRGCSWKASAKDTCCSGPHCSLRRETLE